MFLNKTASPTRGEMLLLFLHTMALAVAVAEARGRPVVTTSLGDVRGNALQEADEFLGIPYGAAARFRAATTRTEAFDEGSLDASYYGPACLQTLTSSKTYGVEHGCHVINVWRPAGAAPGAKLPVMLFVPGGSNDFGEAEPYNASVMAANQNAVITSINYRVGPFGFLAFASDAAAGRETGNHALTDIQAALRFLRREIGAFGGDASRLTLFGQSSGAGLALLHTVVPTSRDLFEGVLSQSGGLGAGSLRSSLATTGVLARALNCTSRGFASERECMLAATGDELVFAQGVSCLTPNDCSALTSWGPAVDGVLVPDDPAALLAAGKVNPAAVALGANTNDSYLFIQEQGPVRREAYIKRLRAEVYPPNATLADALLKVYPPKPGRHADNIDRVGWYSSDAMLCGLRRTAHAFAAAKAHSGGTYLYRYNYWFQSNKTCTAVANYHPPELGSMHQDEISFVFGQPIFMNIGYTNCSVPGWAGYDPSCLGCRFDAREAGFARSVGRLWTNFAASGDPNRRRAASSSAAEDEEEWPPIGTDRNVYLHPTAGREQLMAHEAALGRPEACALWDEIDAASSEAKRAV